jgi:hypothetical protein
MELLETTLFFDGVLQTFSVAEERAWISVTVVVSEKNLGKM